MNNNIDFKKEHAFDVSGFERPLDEFDFKSDVLEIKIKKLLFILSGSCFILFVIIVQGLK